jgi:hypothetical protein
VVHTGTQYQHLFFRIYNKKYQNTLKFLGITPKYHHLFCTKKALHIINVKFIQIWNHAIKVMIVMNATMCCDVNLTGLPEFVKMWGKSHV